MDETIAILKIGHRSEIYGETSIEYYVWNFDL